jgi:uncharacterized protein (DUF2252 family)
MSDVVEQILRYNAGRDPERLAMKYRNMRRGPFVFLRATCHLFPSQLPGDGALAGAPAVWSCGDLHLENFGSYKGDNRLTYFDINDFDEGALLPASWDVVRLLASVRLAAAPLKLPPERVRALCDTLLDVYFAALGDGCARWIERDTAEGPVRELFDEVRRRQRARFLDGRTIRRRRRRELRVDGRKALPAAKKQRARVLEFIARFAAAQPKPKFFEVLDIARRIAGNGSLGVDRYVVLVEGKGSPDANYLLDLKEALPSALEGALTLRQPRWDCEAERVVAIARRVQAVPAAFLHAVRMGKRSYVLRDLQPTADRVAFGDRVQDPARLLSLMRSVGQCTAWAHLRATGRQGAAIADELIAFARETGWRKRLRRASEACARNVSAQWAAFAAAYDEGAFELAAA